MGFLDQLFGAGGDDPRSQAMGLLAGQMMRGNMSGGLLGANQVFAEAPQRKMREQLLQAQIAETQAQAQERQQQAMSQRSAAELQAAQQAGIPGLYGPDGKFDVQKALALRLKPEQITALAGLNNVGRQKVARTQEVDDGRGGKMIVQIDEFGERVGPGMAGYTAPVAVNQGDRMTFVRPEAGISLGVNMSPGDRDASARGWAGVNETKRHHGVTEANAGATAAAGKVPAGYRMKPDGSMEAIPGGPADLKAGADGQKRVGDAKDVLGLLDEVDKLLPGSTGSYLGAGVDQAARVFGKATPGAEATAQLKTLQGALIGKMPKMSGPQSDKDVLLYREMAGQVADSTLPVSTRQAASATIRGLNEKYAGMPEGSSRPPSPAGQTVQSLPKTAPKGQRARDTTTGEVLVFNGMSWVKEK